MQKHCQLCWFQQDGWKGKLKAKLIRCLFTWASRASKMLEELAWWETMAHPRKTHFFTVCVFALMLGLQPVAAQSGRGSGTNTTRNAVPVRPQEADITRNLITVNVVMADGSPPPEPVAIERVCGRTIVRVGYTDAKGFLTFQLMQALPVMQDASESGRDAYTNAGGFGNQPPGSGNVLSTVAGCDLRGLLPGFQSTMVMILPMRSLETVNLGTIVLIRSQEQGATVSATSANAPKGARKAYERASAHLKKHKLTEAQAELEQAVKLYPRYAAAWTNLGGLHEQQNRLDQAREAFSQAQVADDKFVPAYVGLASVAVRQSKWAEAEELSARATLLDGVYFPVAFYYNAVANFQLGQLDKAEKSARKAEQLDMRQSLTQVKLLLGSILDMKQNYAEAAEEFKAYLKVAPTAANAEKVRQHLVELARLSASGPPAMPKDLPSSVAVAPAAEVQSATLTNWEEIGGSAAGNPKPPALALLQSWLPPDIDQVVPPVSLGVPCPVHEVVSGVSSRAKGLMDNLQQFSATERIEHLKVDKAGNPGVSASATFKYFAEIREAHGGVEVDEYRNGSSSDVSFPANLATTGMAAHALIFHPSLIDDLTITCEGLGSVRGRPAWQLHFVQRPDRPPRFRQYRTPKGWFRVGLKGRAWIAADSYQVMRMETDLAKPIEEIALRKDHLTIDYRAVEFRKRNVQLWLPETTDLYLDFLGQRSHRRHSFSDFELFWVDVADKAP
jgi:tetratricopeptide (TPR) repeat protein